MICLEFDCAPPPLRTFLPNLSALLASSAEARQSQSVALHVRPLFSLHFFHSSLGFEFSGLFRGRRVAFKKVGLWCAKIKQWGDANTSHFHGVVSRGHVLSHDSFSPLRENAFLVPCTHTARPSRFLARSFARCARRKRKRGEKGEKNKFKSDAVSYTHLTLPTIYSV